MILKNYPLYCPKCRQEVLIEVKGLQEAIINRRVSNYYLTDDDSMEVGDFVIVPAGNDNHEAVVEVVNIEYFNKDNVPLSIEKTKKIIRKCTDDDFELSTNEGM